MLDASGRLRTQPGAVSAVACGDRIVAGNGTILACLPFVDSLDDEEPLAGFHEAEAPCAPRERLRRVGLGDLPGELVALGAQRPYLGRSFLERSQPGKIVNIVAG